MNDLFGQLLANQVLWAGFWAWFVAQIVKPPIHYFQHREWRWRYVLSAGGMPSSHSALVMSCTTAIGLQNGFNSPIFALAWVISMIVIYDATGVRRQAGDQARILNLMIDELFTGHPLAEKELQERLGHTPRQVLAGIALGIAIAALVVS